MKLLGWVSTGAITLMLGASTVVLAQDRNDDVKPPQQQEEEKRDEAKPRKEEAKPPKQGEAKPENRQEEARPENRPEQESRQQNNGEADKAARQEHPDQQRANARPAGKSERIPDDKFRQHFGREHVVVINRPVIVEGRPRFQNGGYWFEIVDPWPSDWVYTDQVYVDYIDGEYFLFNVAHPGVRIALFVTL
jgi:hypothetical protein